MPSDRAAFKLVGNNVEMYIHISMYENFFKILMGIQALMIFCGTLKASSIFVVLHWDFLHLYSNITASI